MIVGCGRLELKCEDGVCVRHRGTNVHTGFYVTDSDSIQLILSPIDLKFYVLS